MFPRLGRERRIGGAVTAVVPSTPEEIVGVTTIATEVEDFMLRKLVVAVALCLLFLAACTPMRWAKPGASQSQAEAAAEECQRVANTDAWKAQWEDDWPPPWYDSSYMPPSYGSGPVPFWRNYPQTAELEEDMIRFCMHSKGYHLTAART